MALKINTTTALTAVNIKTEPVTIGTGRGNNANQEFQLQITGTFAGTVAILRKIRDINGEGGWVHSSVISGKRSVIVIAKNTMPLLDTPGKYNQIVAKLVPQIRCGFYKCKKDWCQVSCKSYKGWIARKFLWGVYPDE